MFRTRYNNVVLLKCDNSNDLITFKFSQTHFPANFPVDLITPDRLTSYGCYCQLANDHYYKERAPFASFSINDVKSSPQVWLGVQF